MYQNNFAQYKKVEVETTDPLKLIIMLYEGGINFLEQAKLRMRENQVAEKGILISKVMAIVDELQGSLNLEKGGEMAANIDRIYSYIRERLMEANQKNESPIIDEILGHMRTLKEAWTKVYAQERNQGTQAAKPAPQKTQQSAPGNSSRVAMNSGNQQNQNLQAIEFLG